MYEDPGDGHGSCPWRSNVRRAGFDVKGGRHSSWADAALRVLEVYQKHPPFVKTGRFTLAAGNYVSAEQLASSLAASIAGNKLSSSACSCGASFSYAR